MGILDKLSKYSVNCALDDLLVLLLVFIIIYHFIRVMYYIFNNKLTKIKVKTITVSNVTIEIECNRKVRNLAHNAWVELITRKIALPFDEDNDVIVEIYNSWYQIFPEFRKMIKELSDVNDSDVEKLVSILLRVINVELRGHLTKYQARFRKWYENADYKELEPQEIQKKYPKYTELILDLIKVNNEIINLTNQLDNIRREK